MTASYYPIPGYFGQVILQPVGDNEDATLIPCNHMKWRASCDFDLSYSACGSPYPDLYPGLSSPGMLEFWGQWRTDYNPFVTAPILQIGQNVAAQWVVYSDPAIKAYCPQCIVINVDFEVQTHSQGYYHILLAAVWEFEGTHAGTLVRDIGGDNYCGDTGYSD